MITPSRLLKSWATPPASRPTASIFWAWRSCASRLRFSVTSVTRTSRPPAPGTRSGCAATSTSMTVPSFLRCLNDGRRTPDDPRGACLGVRPRAGTSSGGRMSLIVMREELFPRVPVVADRGVVDGEEGQRLRVVDPHGMRVAVEEQPVLLLALGSRSSASFRAVTSDHEPTGLYRLAVRIAGQDLVSVAHPASSCRPCGGSGIRGPRSRFERSVAPRPAPLRDRPDGRGLGPPLRTSDVRPGL